MPSQNLQPEGQNFISFQPRQWYNYTGSVLSFSAIERSRNSAPPIRYMCLSHLTFFQLWRWQASQTCKVPEFGSVTIKRISLRWQAAFMTFLGASMNHLYAFFCIYDGYLLPRHTPWALIYPEFRVRAPIRKHDNGIITNYFFFNAIIYCPSNRYHLLTGALWVNFTNVEALRGTRVFFVASTKNITTNIHQKCSKKTNKITGCAAVKYPRKFSRAWGSSLW